MSGECREGRCAAVRGGGNATRQINSIFPPGFDCHRLVAVEVYTPPGNWSSYPPHKHDVHRVDAAGQLIEADLEEVYFYKLDKPEGYGIQRVYTGDQRLDETIVARDGDVVLLDARRPLGNGRPLPAGTLREAPSALERGHLFLLTRCPEPLSSDVEGLPGPLLHSRHVLSPTAVSLGGKDVPLTELKGKRGAAFAGLADPESFFAALSRAGLALTERIVFADHAPYGPAEIERLRRAAAGADYLVTTEKDGVKLRSAAFAVPCYQVPMTLQVLEEGELEKIICRTVRRGAI